MTSSTLPGGGLSSHGVLFVSVTNANDNQTFCCFSPLPLSLTMWSQKGAANMQNAVCCDRLVVQLRLALPLAWALPCRARLSLTDILCILELFKNCDNAHEHLQTLAATALLSGRWTRQHVSHVECRTIAGCRRNFARNTHAPGI